MHKTCERKKIWGKDRGEASKRVRSGKTEMTDLLASILNICSYLPCENTSTESNIPLLIQFNARKLDFFKHRLTEVSITPYLVFHVSFSYVYIYSHKQQSKNMCGEHNRSNGCIRSILVKIILIESLYLYVHHLDDCPITI